eukprot:7848455-Pyramimonas_sp.AAC.1
MQVGAKEANYGRWTGKAIDLEDHPRATGGGYTKVTFCHGRATCVCYSRAARGLCLCHNLICRTFHCTGSPGLCPGMGLLASHIA